MAKQVLVQSSNDDISRADAWHAFKLLRKQAADVPEMSLDEINAEIAAVRAQKKYPLQQKSLA